MRLALFRLIARLGLLGVLLCMLAACGGARPWFDSANIGINGAAHGVALADGILASRYTADSADASRSADLDTLEAHYAPALRALQIAGASLRTAQREVATARQVGDAPAKCRASVAVQSALADAEQAARELTALGVDVPSELTTGAQALAPIAAALLPSCGADGGSHD